jgi:hypothetical protein
MFFSPSANFKTVVAPRPVTLSPGGKVGGAGAESGVIFAEGDTHQPSNRSIMQRKIHQPISHKNTYSFEKVCSQYTFSFVKRNFYLSIGFFIAPSAKSHIA